MSISQDSYKERIAQRKSQWIDGCASVSEVLLTILEGPRHPLEILKEAREFAYELQAVEDGEAREIMLKLANG